MGRDARPAFMPRRQSKAADGGKEGGDELATASYLDSFLNRAPARSPLGAATAGGIAAVAVRLPGRR
jgi:hypothetical protein